MRVEKNNSALEKTNNLEDVISTSERKGIKDNADKVLAESKKSGKHFDNKNSEDRRELGEALEKVNRTVRVFNKRIHFAEYEKTGELWVHIIDAESNKVLKQIPPEEILEIKSRIEEMVGLLVDEKR